MAFSLITETQKWQSKANYEQRWAGWHYVIYLNTCLNWNLNMEMFYNWDLKKDKSYE